MATAIPADIDCLEGRPRLRAIHEWRIDVHRRRRIKGVIAAAIALAAFAAVVLTITAITALLVATFATGAATGGSLVYACMHGRKVSFHREQLAELSA